MEKWKDIEGWEGIYQVSNHGRIKSFKADPDGRILSNTNRKGGYLSIVLCATGRPRKSDKVHRLVASAFVPNPCGKPEVNHKDGDKQNNHFGNLEWVTPSENIKHAVKRNPNMVAGMNHYNKHVKTRTILQVNHFGCVVGRFPNSREAAKETGVCSRNILQVASKKEFSPGRYRMQAGGFSWRYEDEFMSQQLKL